MANGTLNKKGNREPMRGHDREVGSSGRVDRAQKVRRAAPVAGVMLVALVAAVITAAPTPYEADLALLSNVDAQKRQDASDRLGKGGSKQATKLLDELAGKHSAVTRAGLVRSLSKLPVSGDHVSALRDLLASDNVNIAASAALILQKAPKARDKLVAELADVLADDRVADGVKARAARALKGTTGAGATALEAAAASSGLTKLAAIRTLGFIPTSGPGKLATIATDEEREDRDRVLAMRSLGEVTGSNASSASSELKTLVKSTSGFVREHATAALSARGESGSTSTFVTLAKDKDARVRLEALRAIESAKAVSSEKSTVKTLLSDSDVRVQELALRLAAAEKPWDLSDVKSTFVSELGSKNFKIRLGAALALAAYGDKGGLQTMKTDKDSSTKSVAAQAKAAYDLIDKIEE